MAKRAQDSIEKECINFHVELVCTFGVFQNSVGDKHNGGLMLNDIYLKMLSFIFLYIERFFVKTHF